MIFYTLFKSTILPCLFFLLTFVWEPFWTKIILFFTNVLSATSSRPRAIQLLVINISVGWTKYNCIFYIFLEGVQLLYFCFCFSWLFWLLQQLWNLWRHIGKIFVIGHIGKMVFRLLTMLHCYNFTILQCCNVAKLQCYNIIQSNGAMLQCYNVAMLQYYPMLSVELFIRPASGYRLPTSSL